MEQKTRITNVSKSQLVSDILEVYEQIAEQQSNKNLTEVEKENIPGTKGEVFVTIMTGLAIRAIYDILKYAVLRFVNRNDYNKNAIIKVEDKEVTLDEIINQK
jgi:hypothetical protein